MSLTKNPETQRTFFHCQLADSLSVLSVWTAL